MMKRSGILCTGKKIIVVTILSVLPLSADFELTLIDKDGIESKQCVKSYSFSNNLESLSRANGVGKEVYSQEESMTNKVYFGKPVYRKVFKFADFNVPYSNSNVLKETPVISPEVDELVDLSFKGYDRGGLISANYTRHIVYSNTGASIRLVASYNRNSKKAYVLFTHNRIENATLEISDLSITVEYTKTTDVQNDSSSEFKSYLHYVLSSSSTNEVTTVDLENTGVKLLKNYTYDNTTDSCNPN